jgi:di/tripeptidase
MNRSPENDEILFFRHDIFELGDLLSHVFINNLNFYWNLKEGFPISCIIVSDLYEKAYEKVVQKLIDSIKNTTDYDKKNIFMRSLIPFYSKISNKQLIIEVIKVTVKTLKDDITNKMDLLATSLGGKLRLESDYPAWEYAKGSKLEKICVETYEKLTGKKPVIMAIHAGLECGLLLDKMPHAQAISLGPDMFEVHTPNEHLSISSTKRTWDYLVAILKGMNEY